MVSTSFRVLSVEMKFHLFHNVEFGLRELSISDSESFWRFEVLSLEISEILAFDWIWSTFGVQMLGSEFQEFHWIRGMILGLREVLIDLTKASSLFWPFRRYVHFLWLSHMSFEETSNSYFDGFIKSGMPSKVKVHVWFVCTRFQTNHKVFVFVLSDVFGSAVLTFAKGLYFWIFTFSKVGSQKQVHVIIRFWGYHKMYKFSASDLALVYFPHFFRFIGLELTCLGRKDKWYHTHFGSLHAS